VNETVPADREKTFVGTDAAAARIDRLLSDPARAAKVAEAQPEADEMDRVHAMNLAMVRKAAHLTQIEMARRLGVGQGVVSRLENRDDMLLSTLYDYLTATGASGVSIVLTVNGRPIELDLAAIRDKEVAAKS